MELPNYTITKRLHVSEYGSLVRATQKESGSPCIIRFLKSRMLSESEEATFREEYRRIGNSKQTHRLPVRFIELSDQGVTVVYDDFPGTLFKHASFSLPLEAGIFIEIAIQLTHALLNLHDTNIVHKAVIPDNILINPDVMETRICGFGADAEVTGENQDLYNPYMVHHRLPYISPEQTGRIKLPVDTRSDLYSLGVVLYELITGKLPFISDNPVELIHSHIAVTPAAPVTAHPAVPAVISDIIIKLLSKDADKRYQSAYGLLSDLDRCRELMRDKKTIPDFDIGTQDINTRFDKPGRLFGRKTEIETLNTIFNDSCQGEKNSVLITGSSGIGKSALVNEITTSVAKRNGYFVSGKFEQFMKNRPYSAIIQAFQGLVHQLLSESDDELKRWKEKIQTILGVNGKIITDMIPELEVIIGSQPPLAKLDNEGTKNRFHIVFGSFISVFADARHPLVVFLDDIQWADTASLQLINRFMDIDMNHILVIFTCRDDELPEVHPVEDLMNAIQSGETHLHILHLSSLPIDVLGTLVAESFKMPKEKAVTLAGHVYRKTEGNPFFVNRFLQALYDKKIIQPDMRHGWTWDEDAITSLEISENVVELMLEKIKELSRPSVEALMEGAILGNNFNPVVIADMLNLPVGDIIQALTDPVDTGLILPSEGDFVFCHDKIHEAAYSLIPDHVTTEKHYRAGNYFLKSKHDDYLGSDVFYITGHLNKAVSLMQDKEERFRLAGLNLTAGRKAKESAAYSPSLKYIETCLSLLDDSTWDTQYAMTLEAHLEYAEIASINGDYEITDKAVEIISVHAKNILDKTRAYRLKINILVAREQFKEAVRFGLEVLKPLGIRISESPSKAQVIMQLIKTSIVLAGKENHELLSLPKMKDPEMLVIMPILESLSSAAYHGYPDVFAILIFKGVRVAIKHGHSPEHPYMYVAYGIILTSVLKKIEKGNRIAKLGIDLMYQMDLKKQECNILFIYNSLVRHWTEPLRETLSEFKSIYSIGIETGATHFAAYSLYFECAYSYRCGKNLFELEQMLIKNKSLIENLNQYHVLRIHMLYYQTVYKLIGKDGATPELSGRFFDIAKEIHIMKEANEQNTLHSYYNLSALFKYTLGDYEGARGELIEAENYLGGGKGTTLIRNYTFIDSLTRLALMDAMPPEKRKNKLKVIRKHLKSFRFWAEHSPVNNNQHLYMIEAEYARVTGNYYHAAERFDKAISLAAANGYTYEEALANELAFKFYLKNNKRSIARAYLDKAMEVYQAWGAKIKIDQIKLHYSDFLMTDSGEDRISQGAIGQLDYSTVVKSLQVVSEEIVLEDLIRKLMKTVIENAGAERGVFLLKKQNIFHITADCRVTGIDEKKGEPVIEFSLQDAAPLNTGSDILLPLINLVGRTATYIVLDNAEKEGDFIHDMYVKKSEMKSVLCMPVFHKSEVIGILYLENSRATGVFNLKRIEVLELLASQATISLEHAKLYDTLKKSEYEVRVLNEELEQRVEIRTRELNDTLKKVETANRHIMSSINYSSIIQRSLLPDTGIIQKTLPDSFFLWEPRDIIGGDIYFFEPLEAGFILVVADCTGHGVPGALMTMITISGLRRIINEEHQINPASILRRLNVIVKTTLQMDKEHSLSDDGLDAAVCFYNNTTDTLEFAGAKIPLYYIDNGNLSVVKGDRKSLGYSSTASDYEFTRHVIRPAGGRIVYIATDGYTDQLGGTPKKRRFGSKKFRQLIHHHHKKPFSEQQKILMNHFNKHRGGFDIIDDITVTGFKLPAYSKYHMSVF